MAMSLSRVSLMNARRRRMGNDFQSNGLPTYLMDSTRTCFAVKFHLMNRQSCCWKKHVSDLRVIPVTARSNQGRPVLWQYAPLQTRIIRTFFRHRIPGCHYEIYKLHMQWALQPLLAPSVHCQHQPHPLVATDRSAGIPISIPIATKSSMI